MQCKIRSLENLTSQVQVKALISTPLMPTDASLSGDCKLNRCITVPGNQQFLSPKPGSTRLGYWAESKPNCMPTDTLTMSTGVPHANRE